MTLQRITVDAEIDGKLRYLTGRVGLKANLLCRLGLCLSIEEPGLPDGALYKGEEEGGSGREFNRYTLLGEFDLFFMALLRERLLLDGLDPHNETVLEDQFKAHLGRGVSLLSLRLKGLEDLADLVTAAMDRCMKHLDPGDFPDGPVPFFPYVRASPVEEEERDVPVGEGTREAQGEEQRQPTRRKEGSTRGRDRPHIKEEDTPQQLPLQGFS